MDAYNNQCGLTPAGESGKWPAPGEYGRPGLSGHGHGQLPLEAHARLAAVFAVFAFSALMELLQHFAPYRNGSCTDVGINAVGCFTGVLVFMAGARLCLLIRKRLGLS